MMGGMEEEDVEFESEPLLDGWDDVEVTPFDEAVEEQPDQDSKQDAYVGAPDDGDDDVATVEFDEDETGDDDPEPDDVEPDGDPISDDEPVGDESVDVEGDR